MEGFRAAATLRYLQCKLAIGRRGARPYCTPAAPVQDVHRGVADAREDEPVLSGQNGPGHPAALDAKHVCPGAAMVAANKPEAGDPEGCDDEGPVVECHSGTVSET